MNHLIHHGRTEGGGAGSCPAAASPKPPKPKFRKHRFCRQYEPKSLTRFQPKSATEVG
jgi:hypothetical protein